MGSESVGQRTVCCCIDLFTLFFQLLTLTSSGKSVDTTQKSAFKLIKLPSLNVIC